MLLDPEAGRVAVIRLCEEVLLLFVGEDRGELPGASRGSAADFRSDRRSSTPARERSCSWPHIHPEDNPALI